MKMTLVALLAAATVLPSLPSSAASACPLVPDATGDVQSGGQKVDDGNVDILSANVAAGTKQVAAVVRLAKLEARDPIGGPVGDRTYVVYFKYATERTQRFLSMKGFGFSDTSGTLREFRFGHLDNDGFHVLDGTATGSVNPAAGTVSVSAPLAAWKPVKLATMARLKTMSGIRVVATTNFAPVDDHGYGPSPANTNQLNPFRPVDTATTTRKVVIGVKGCVPAA